MTKKSYQELQEELEGVLEKLQSETVDLDEAIEFHKKGTAIIKEMQRKLDRAEIKIKKLK